MDIFLQQLANGLTIGSMFALVALGYTMVYGVMRLINFAHGDMVAASAFVGLTILYPGAWTGSLLRCGHRHLPALGNLHGGDRRHSGTGCLSAST